MPISSVVNKQKRMRGYAPSEIPPSMSGVLASRVPVREVVGYATSGINGYVRFAGCMEKRLDIRVYTPVIPTRKMQK